MKSSFPAAEPIGHQSDAPEALAVTGIRPCVRALGFVITDNNRNIILWERELEYALMAFRGMPSAYAVTRCADYELMGYAYVRGGSKPILETDARENRPSRDKVIEYSERARAMLRSGLDTLPPPPAEGDDVDVSDEADTLRSIRAGIAILESEWEREDALDVCISPSSRMPPVEIVDDEDDFEEAV